MNLDQINGVDTRGIALIKAHFNAITPENVTKWELIQPEEGRFDFEPVDKFVAFGLEHSMHMIGHTLVWHSQTPRWVFEGENGAPATRELLLERMRTHIHTVVGRYKGKIHTWDVVNEALNEDGSYRQSEWYTIIGQDYLLKAFTYAHEADPDAKLIYNDYSLENPAKRAGAIRLVRYLQENGVPIHAIGTQGHFDLEFPSRQLLEDTLVEFSALGIEVMVTELDLDVLPSPFAQQSADVNLRADASERMNPYVAGLPDSVQQAHALRYRELFEVFMAHQSSISRVSFWGVTDADSWKNNWPIPGRTNYTLIFDRDGQPKPAFHQIMEVAKQ